MNTLVWQPTTPETTRLWAFMRYIKKTHEQPCNDYQSLHTWSIENPALFWQALCDFFNIRFDTNATQILNHYEHMIDARWFQGATFNFAQQLLSRFDEHPALICINEPGARRVYSYRELSEQVQGCAAGLKHVGVKCGDRVAAILPNTAYAIIAMLATASIGAIWASCSPDFGLDAAVDRLGQVEPRVLFLCDGYQYQGKSFDTLNKMQAITALIPSLAHVVVCPYGDNRPTPPPFDDVMG